MHLVFKGALQMFRFT